MQVNLGGVLDPADVVGREAEVEAAVRSPAGVLFTGDRRMGKTCITRVVEVRSAGLGHHVAQVSAERATLDDFVAALGDQLLRLGGRARREVARWQAGVRAGPVTATRAPPTAADHLDDLVRRAVEAAQPEPLVLIVDEVPVLAQTLEHRRAGAGSELLHLLRRLRQDHHRGLRMVLSGSIGFHHVTADAPGTVNDVDKINVGPLHHDDAVFLARCLLAGERVAVTGEIEVAEAIARAAEQIPYYVHHLVAAAGRTGPRRGRPLGPTDVGDLVDSALSDPDDPWDLRHYRDRLVPYYGPDDAVLAGAVLDDCAARGVRSIDQLVRATGALDLGAPQRRDHLVRIVERLEADHYLVQDGGGDRFASELVRRAWLRFRR